MTQPHRRGWKRRRLTVLERDGYVCHWCGAYATHADHLLEYDRGGSDDLSNLVASCGHCNMSRGNRYRADRDRNTRVSSSRSWFGS